MGYALGLASGYLSDRTQRYWTITLVGYVVNLLAVPLLALAGHWPVAAALIVLERLGKGIRTPARDAMLSHATQQMGRGWGFGLHEAMDQTGAILGPLIVTAVLYWNGSYRVGFAVLLIPALLALGVLVAAWSLYPRPQELEVHPPNIETAGLPRAYWRYLIAASLVAAGYANFSLIGYHFEKTAAVADTWIPILYAVAMGTDALAALMLGALFDRIGIPVLAAVTSISALFVPLVFGAGFYPALLGMALWGIGMGAQESIMRAAVAAMTPVHRRGAAYGIFNTGYGLAWFAGSALMGLLYDQSVSYVILFSVIAQLAAIPLFLHLGRQGVREATGHG